MELRKLNEHGIKALESFLDDVRSGGHATRPSPSDSRLSETIGETSVNLNELPDTSRMEAGRFLMRIIDDVPELNLDRNQGFWSWLSLLYFDRLCPPSKAGIRKPGETARWIPAFDNYKKYYRHLLHAPWKLCSLYRDELEIIEPLLSKPLHQPGDFYEQIASRQELITNPSVLKVIKIIYWNAETGSPKKNSSSSKSRGSLRRLADVVQQFSRTYDLYSMEADAILDILPPEFDSFSRAK